MTTPHRATPEQWASVRRRAVDSGISDCCAIMELSARIKALEATQHAHAERQGQPTPIATDEELQKAWTSLPGQGWNAARRAAQATCPHIVSGAEGTSYCRLAEQTQDKLDRLIAQDRAASAEARPNGLVEDEIVTIKAAAKAWNSVPGKGHIAALRAVYDLGRQHGSAQATCPHIVSGAEGTSYCRLAEQTAAPVTPMDELRAASAEARPAVGGPVDRLMAQGYGKTHARAAIREVVQTLRASFFEHAAKWLEQEAGLG